MKKLLLAVAAVAALLAGGGVANQNRPFFMVPAYNAPHTLRALLDAHDREQAPSLWPSMAEIPVAIDKTLAEPLLESDEYVYWAI